MFDLEVPKSPCSVFCILMFSTPSPSGFSLGSGVLEVLSRGKTAGVSDDTTESKVGWRSG